LKEGEIERQEERETDASRESKGERNKDRERNIGKHEKTILGTFSES